MIFVTGATGLVGSQLIQKLLKQGKQVRALYRNRIPEIPFAKKIQWIKGDILDIIALEEATQNVEEVYHCAAIVSFNPRFVDQMFKTNVEGTANVVNACLAARVKKLCHVSSVAALGRIRKNEVVNENMNWSEETSNSQYGKSKHFAEVEVWRGISEGLEAVIVNPVIVLGAGDWDKGSSGIFKSAYNEFPWFTEGVTGFVDVIDVVEAMVQLMEQSISGQRFILSEGDHTYKEVFTLVAQGFGKKPPHKKVTPFIASIVWRVEALKAMFTGTNPLLTKETAETAQAVVHFDNTKLFKYLPTFRYTPLNETIKRVCLAFAASRRKENLDAL
jgi:nucleoside-diphosphate-sugar epimerase